MAFGPGAVPGLQVISVAAGRRHEMADGAEGVDFGPEAGSEPGRRMQRRARPTSGG